MRRLAQGVELLDGPLDDPAALDGNLRDLRRINRWLGGVALSIAAVEALTPRSGDLTLLDIGTGGADIPLALVRWATRRGQRLTVVAADSRPEVLAAARRTNPEVDRTPALTLEVAEGTSLPHDDASFDVAHASLVLHHLEPDAAAALLREMARVARRGVVVNDLERGWLAWLGAWLLGHLLTRNRFTRRDAPLSVRRAYRRDEASALVRAAGLAPVLVRRGSFGQRYSIAAVILPPSG